MLGARIVCLEPQRQLLCSGRANQLR